MDAQEAALYHALVISTVVLVASLAFFAYRYNRKNRLYFDSKRKTEVSLVEMERNRISCDIHDEVLPNLMTANMMIKEVIKSIDGHENLHTADKILREMIISMRGIISNLNAGYLVRNGLGVSVNELVKQLSVVHAIKIVFRYDVCFEPAEEMSIQIYRIVLELLHNSTRHSGASEVHVLFYGNDHEFRVEYGDNGKGFQPRHAPEGVGLVSIRDRTLFLSGEMDCESVPGKGTRYLFKFPMQ